MTRVSSLLRSSSRLRALIVASVATITLGSGLACDRNALGPKEVGPDGRALGRIAVVVPVGNQQATAVTVTVSAVDIPTPMTFNFPIVGGVAAGSIAVPAGSGRLITVSAFDGSVETHRGTATLTINAGNNPTTSITLVPLAGTIPITASFGTVVITVTPATASPKVGDTLRFNATIRDATGTIVPGPARWASTNTAKVLVDTAGLATVLDTGNVSIVATYSTSAAIASLSNQPAAGGPIPAFLRTWVGGSGTGQNRNRWDVANNWTPAFVPTVNDSVVIAATAFQPIIPVDTFSVRDLILRTGATLDAFCCGIRLRVAHVASGEGGTFGPSIYGLLMRNGAVLQGTLPANINMGPAVSASLADSARIGSLTVDGAAASFDLAGKRLVVTGNLFVNNGGLLRVDRAADTLDVGAQFQITNTAAAHLGALTAGTIIFRGVNNYFDGFQASGTNTVVFQPATAGSQNVNSMNYTSVGQRLPERRGRADVHGQHLFVRASAGQPHRAARFAGAHELQFVLPQGRGPDDHAGRFGRDGLDVRHARAPERHGQHWRGLVARLHRLSRAVADGQGRARLPERALLRQPDARGHRGDQRTAAD